MTGCSGHVASGARVDTAVLAAQLLENEHTVEFSRLRFHVQAAVDWPPVSEPADLHGKVSGRYGARDLSSARFLNLRWEAEWFYHRRSCQSTQCNVAVRLISLKRFHLVTYDIDVESSLSARGRGGSSPH